MPRRPASDADDPAQAFARIAAEACLLAGAGRALLLQLAEPGVARAVAAHSDFANRPLDRLAATLEYVYAVALGTPDDLVRVRLSVDAAHAPVVGTRRAGAPAYSARDPRLQSWVAATLVDTTRVAHEEFLAPLTLAERHAVAGEGERLATALQVPAGRWPAPDAFDDWFTERAATLEVGDDARAVAATIFAGAGLPAPLRMLLPFAKDVTALLLPAAIRAGYGLELTEADERRIRARIQRWAWVYRVLPRWVRTAPARRSLARLRRR